MPCPGEDPRPAGLFYFPLLWYNLYADGSAGRHEGVNDG